jgi:YHS domain-containing protein
MLVRFQLDKVTGSFKIIIRKPSTVSHFLMPAAKTIPTSDRKKSTAELTRFVTLCGHIVHADPAYFPRAEYRGKTIYFCTESCLDAFLADPDVFYKVHRKSKKKKGA